MDQIVIPGIFRFGCEPPLRKPVSRPVRTSPVSGQSFPELLGAVDQMMGSGPDRVIPVAPVRLVQMRPLWNCHACGNLNSGSSCLGCATRRVHEH